MFSEPCTVILMVSFWRTLITNLDKTLMPELFKNSNSQRFKVIFLGFCAITFSKIWTIGAYSSVPARRKDPWQ